MKSTLISALLAAIPLSTVAQVRINEVVASNTRSFPDIVDFEDYPDWLELHNEGASAASLDGYFLSDDPAQPRKWQIPDGTAIPAGGYLVIAADGNDSGIGESYPRGYWPWRNFTTERLHTNFSLSADGESVILSKVAGQQPSNLLTLGSSWNYLDDGSSQNDDWKARLFDDSTWASGPAPLGYGDDPATVISYGPDDNDRHITSYLRQSFDVVDPSNIASLTITMQVDDSCIIYLNGLEVVRHNLPEGTITSETTSVVPAAPPGEADFHTYQITSEQLVVGSNSLSVEVHQSSASSVDMRFDLQLESHTSGILSQVDAVIFGTQVTDVALGRGLSDPLNWYFLAEATPGAANSPRAVNDIRITSPGVEISPASGLYGAPQTITLTSDPGEIYYTTDGSNPSTNTTGTTCTTDHEGSTVTPSTTTLYTGPFQITETTVVRARCFTPGQVPGAIQTQTFFIGETFQNLPFVSVAADPCTLFDDTIGIYLNNHEPNREVYKGKDAPGYLEFFPNDGSKGFAVNGGVRIGGENNWFGRPQKALNFSLKGKYGDDEIKYNLFPQTGIPIHTGLSLREGGDNWRNAMLRDSLWWYVAADRQLNIDSTARRPAVAFVNGKYWGLYNIRDRWDEQWFHQHYGVDNGNYDHLGFGRFTSSTTTLGIHHGDLTEWNTLYDFIRTSDLSLPENWAFVESKIEIDSYIDFVICESYGNNTSWGHNREFWKDRKPGGKWRWFIPDMDRTWQSGNANGNVFSSMLSSSGILSNLRDNTGFRERLAQRFAAHVYSTFSPTRLIPMINDLGDLLDLELDRHVAEWNEAGTTRTRYYDQLDDIKSFVNQRPDNMMSLIRSGLNLSPAIDLNLSVTGEGLICLAGVKIPVGDCQIFPGIPTLIVAEPAPGFAFSHWSGINGGATTEFTANNNLSVAANFIPDGSTVVSGSLTVDTTWTMTGSPYVILEDLIIPAGITLTVNSGVEIQVTSSRNIRVLGTLIINGSPQEKVSITGRNGAAWGGISFEEPVTTSTLAHLSIRNASRGHAPTIYPAAIAGLNADLEMDFLDIDDCRGPLFFRGGSMILKDSFIHIPITGDGLNVKQGLAQTIRCTFLGNNSPDTDAIDYDGVVNGVIRDCRIYRFLGFNSDGIDTGEQCVDVLIEGNRIFFNSDKGVSVGQGSSVIMRKNLVVGCPLGVGVKDTGSTIIVDQNTFVDCAEGVSVFEKNFGGGGGIASVTNTIFTSCSLPVFFDALSSITVAYSLSDTTPLSGPGNINTDPQFIDPLSLNFGLSTSSPAIDAGDPNHENDPDNSRVDIGAAYRYDPDDYPFDDLNTVVINEILANSGPGGDWIELLNRSNGPIDISGWFISDDGSNLAKYRIAQGTTIAAGEHLVFYEDIHFGSDSVDPNALVPFALSNTGETVHLSSAQNDSLTGYRFSENFGATFRGETAGYYFKPGSGNYNFVRLASPTSGNQNNPPKNGPVVISEIMYNVSGDEDAEYLELLNISNSPVSLYDSGHDLGWTLSKGIAFTFTAGTVILPHERIIITRDSAAFTSTFTAPVGTQVFQWTSGKLSNSGDTIQLNQPGPLNDLLEVEYVRMDRVNYGTAAPWSENADGTGSSLNKIAESSYGNDAFNWTASAPSPGGFISVSNFEDWANGLNSFDDNDADGLSNLLEYALGTDPDSFEPSPIFGLTHQNETIALDYSINLERTDVSLKLEQSPDLMTWTEVDLPPVANDGTTQQRMGSIPRQTVKGYFRLTAESK